MKIAKKHIAFVVFISLLFGISNNAFAMSITEIGEHINNAEIGYTKDYERYLSLSDEEKENVLIPRMYPVTNSTLDNVSNPLKIPYVRYSATDPEYNLTYVIRENIVVRNQKATETCWAFSMIASLESNLAMQRYKAGLNAVEYDFSEIHMEYATSNVFTRLGFNRPMNGGGNWYLSIPYLISDYGPVADSFMPMPANGKLNTSITEAEIAGGTKIARVRDTVLFPYPEDHFTETDKNNLIKNMKEYIVQYGALTVSIHGAACEMSDTKCYNATNYALYCTDSTCPVEDSDHSVAVVGWKDTYPKEKFANSVRGSSIMPSRNGAWIIKNSWGTAYGDEGFMYVSYDDKWIYEDVVGISNSSPEVDYDFMYDYAPLGYSTYIPFDEAVPHMYFINKFSKKTTESEFLTSVAMNTNENTIAEVYVNPNGTQFSDLRKVNLANTESNPAGYHTFELAEPVEIKSSEYLVAVRLQNVAGQLTLITENANVPLTANARVESGKCFIAMDDDLPRNVVIDVSKFSDKMDDPGLAMLNGDLTVKAFTSKGSNLKIIQNVELDTTCRYEQNYNVGDNFKTEGLALIVHYTNGEKETITEGYTIENGNNLQLGTSYVKAVYKGFEVNIPVNVIEKERIILKEIEIVQNPTTMEYEVGQNFKTDGMIIDAHYSDGSTKNNITGYIVINGANLLPGQHSVDIKYEEDGIAVTTTLDGVVVNVTRNLTSIEITTKPTKLTYKVGDTFQREGMVVTGHYDNNTDEIITAYTVSDEGPYRDPGDKELVISYSGCTAKLGITVEEVTVTGIAVKDLPTKRNYTTGETTLSLAGGTITVSYSDNTTKDEPMENNANLVANGFDTSSAGDKTIELVYMGSFKANFQISVAAPPVDYKNTDWKQANTDLIAMKVYEYVELQKDDYVLLTVEVNKINRVLTNDTAEYYYYLSTNNNETGITDWIKITDNQTDQNKLKFDINTKDLKNYSDILKAGKIYLYIKERVTKGGQEGLAYSSAMEVMADEDFDNIEYYRDDKKLSSGDPTESPDPYPFTGKIMILIAAVSIIIVGSYGFIKYKILDK